MRVNESAGPFFPKTRWSAIRDATDPSSPSRVQSLEQIAALYWRPVYAYLRRKWGHSNEDAMDLTQEFFVALCEKEFLRRLTPERGRFRAYIMTALDNFTRMRHRHQTRLKRGGGVAHMSIEFGPGFEPAFGSSPEQVFLREWARTILKDAIVEMKGELDPVAFRVFEAYDLSPDNQAGYEELAAKFGLSLSDVKNTLYRTRVKLRELVLKRVRDTVTTEEDAEREMREVFGE